MAEDTRWLFADQLGPQYLDREDQRVLLVESTRVLARRRFHRQKAHLVLVALRRRARELGDRATYVRAPTYREAVEAVRGPVSVCEPTSYAAEAFVRGLAGVTVVRNGGFVTHRDEFRAWARGRRRLLLEDFYREQRIRTGVLMEGSTPVGGRWNLDHDNREPPPKGADTLGADEPWWPAEDDVDEEVRADLDRREKDGEASFVGTDGPRRFAATREEALAALDRFVTHRLAGFGPHEDAMLAGDRTMSHSLLSAPLNLGLLHPLEVVHAAERAYRDGRAPLNSVEGFVRQVLGWRDYVWNVYWYFGRDYRRENALAAHAPVPGWLADLDPSAVTANCLAGVVGDLREHGWVHHIPRLMVLGNYALQRGVDPAALTDWFHRTFVDGYDWVMAPNVVGMSQHADGGRMATKPYAAGGAYLHRMSDYCGGCAYTPTKRLGPDACPFTAGYWAFLDRTADRLAGNPRMRQALRGRERLADLAEVVDQERERGLDPP